MYVRARVRAPAILVQVVDCMDEGVVVERMLVRLVRSSRSMRRKGRYLLLSFWEVLVALLAVGLGPLSLRRFVGSERLSKLEV